MKTKILLVVCVTLIVGGAIAASPAKATFVPVPNPEPCGTGGTGTR